MLAVVDDRGQWMREHPVEVGVTVLSAPILPAPLQAIRLLRLLRLRTPRSAEPTAAMRTDGDPAPVVDLSEIPRSARMSGGGALVLLISVFVDWYTWSVFGWGSNGVAGWDATDVAKLVFLLALITIAAWIVELFVPTVTLTVPAWMIAGSAGILSVLLVLIRIVSKPSNLDDSFAKTLGISMGTSFGIWLALWAAVAIVVGAYLRMNEPRLERN
jgi:hypothetical protein